MKSVMISILVFAGLAMAASAAQAQAAQYPRISGNSCQPRDPTSAGLPIYRGLGGINNSSTTTTLALACPVQFSGSALTTATVTSNGARVYYDDENATSGAAVVCTEYMQKSDNTTVNVGTVYSCSTAGGCSSGSNTFTGTGYLSFSASAATSDTAQIFFSCNLPLFPSGGGISYLRSIWMSLTVS